MAPIGFLNPPAGLEYEYAWDVNGAGHVVGEGFNSAGNYRGFLYDGTTVIDVGVLSGFTGSMAFGINTSDQVVGTLEVTAGNTRAFVYSAGVLQNLNDLIPGAPGWVLTEARAINDAGYIAGTGIAPSGQAHAFLLKPVVASPPKVTSAQFAFATAPRRLVLQFSEDVGASLGAEDVVIRNRATGAAVGGWTLGYDPQTRVATVTFPSELADGDYRTTVLSAGVVGPSGAALDGDGDSAPGGDFVFDFFSFAGDANHDRAVDFNDLVALAQSYNTSGKTFAQGDFTGDGTVDFNDLVILAQRYNTTLPEAGSAVMASGAGASVLSAGAGTASGPVDGVVRRSKSKSVLPPQPPAPIKRVVVRPTFGNVRVRGAR
jgi:probable HAF family extracellular repeat protein